MSWLAPLKNKWVFGSVVIAAILLTYFAHVNILQNRIDSKDETIADQRAELIDLTDSLDRQNAAVINLRQIAAESRKYNDAVLISHSAEKEAAEKSAIKARARLEAALANNDCASQELPEAVRLEF